MNISEVKKILDCVIMGQCNDGSFNDPFIIKNLLAQRISVDKVENPCTGFRALNSERIIKFEQLIASIAEYCDGLDIQYYFPKAFQHYPDMGNDIDLFINIDTKERKDLIKHFELAADETSFLNIISGKHAYLYKDQIPLETHQYAGHFGEFKALTQEFYGGLILENGVYQLSDEFKFINQIIQRFFGHFSIRLSDIIYSINLLNKGIDLAGQRDILKKAFSLKKITHVAISINSPGGSPVQSHLIYSYIRQLAEKNKVKVIIFAEDVAASGGYLISCAGDEIYANSSSIIGSIGVISASFGFKDLIKKIGVERRVYTAGKNKSTLDPFVEEKEEDVKRLKNIQLELHADFIKVVEISRGSKLKDPEKNNIFTGEFWTGKTSLGLGLIDGIGNADQVLKEKFGDKVIIKNFEKPKGFIARKLSSSTQDPVDRLANILEEKSMWQKFGL